LLLLLLLFPLLFVLFLFPIGCVADEEVLCMVLCEEDGGCQSREVNWNGEKGVSEGEERGKKYRMRATTHVRYYSEAKQMTRALIESEKEESVRKQQPPTANCGYG